jgi:Na+/phosphate symporter
MHRSQNVILLDYSSLNTGFLTFAAAFEAESHLTRRSCFSGHSFFCRLQVERRALRIRPMPAPLYLDEAAILTLSVALACAARETLHMGDVVEDMLRKTMTALMTNDRKLVAEISRMDNIVDRLDEAIKLYVTKITRESLDERDGRRATEIISFAINLEHIGDIIDKNLMELALKKIQHKYEFSKEGNVPQTDN